MDKRIKELEDKIATLEKAHKQQRMQNEGAYNGFYATLNLLEKADPIKAIMVRAQNKGYLKGLKFALNLIKYKVDENAETLEDKQETSMFDDVLAIKDLADKIKR